MKIAQALGDPFSDSLRRLKLCPQTPMFASLLKFPGPCTYIPWCCEKKVVEGFFV